VRSTLKQNIRPSGQVGLVFDPVTDPAVNLITRQAAHKSRNCSNYRLGDCVYPQFRIFGTPQKNSSLAKNQSVLPIPTSPVSHKCWGVVGFQPKVNVQRPDLLPTNFDQTILLQVPSLICTHFSFLAFKKNFIRIEELHLHLPASLQVGPINRSPLRFLFLLIFGQNCCGIWPCAQGSVLTATQSRCVNTMSEPTNTIQKRF